GTVRNLTTGADIRCQRTPEMMLRILNEGGLLPFIRKYQGFDVRAVEGQPE
ncbi:unnamed protein product, partial [marine sediment metagenome]